MLRYYTYYSVGGYKDLILGTSESKQDATYYLPLLPVLEERAKEKNVDAEMEFERLNALPKIQQLSADKTYNLPVSARTLFSHGGYKLLYKHLEDDYYALALRDITNDSKDEYGRVIPFMFVIVGDTKEDAITLNRLATYFASNIKSVESFLMEVLYMDIDANGLKFELAKFSAWIKTVCANNPTAILPTINGQLPIYAKANRVALLIIPKGLSEQKAISEQNLGNMEITSIREPEIISKENPERLVEQILSLAEELKDERKKNVALKKVLIATSVAGLLTGALITSYCCK